MYAWSIFLFSFCFVVFISVSFFAWRVGDGYFLKLLVSTVFWICVNPPSKSNFSNGLPYFVFENFIFFIFFRVFCFFVVIYFWHEMTWFFILSMLWGPLYTDVVPMYIDGTLFWPKIEYREIHNLVNCLDIEEPITEKYLSAAHFFGSK